MSIAETEVIIGMLITGYVVLFHYCVSGPGLAIRVICAEEPYVCKDFPETNNILKIIADFSASVKKVINIARICILALVRMIMNSAIGLAKFTFMYILRLSWGIIEKEQALWISPHPF